MLLQKLSTLISCAKIKTNTQEVVVNGFAVDWECFNNCKRNATQLSKFKENAVVKIKKVWHTCLAERWRHLLPTNVGNRPHVYCPSTTRQTSRRTHRRRTCRSDNKPQPKQRRKGGIVFSSVCLWLCH